MKVAAVVERLAVECGSDWSFEDPTATDACGPATLTLLDTLTNSVTACSYLAQRIWQASDTCGNSTTCTVTLTGKDVPPARFVRYVESAEKLGLRAPSADDALIRMMLATRLPWTKSTRVSYAARSPLRTSADRPAAPSRSGTSKVVAVAPVWSIIEPSNGIEPSALTAAR